MIQNPEQRGRALAEFYRTVGPRLLRDLEESGLLGESPSESARAEWACFAMYACVRGLVAAGGFNRETGAALDAFHDALLSDTLASAESDASFDARRALISKRYEEYGAIGQAGGASGAASVTARLGERAAEYLAAPDPPAVGLAELAGGLHEALAEGAAEIVRQAE